MLHDSNKYVRRAAANALGRIGDQSTETKEDQQKRKEDNSLARYG